MTPEKIREVLTRYDKELGELGYPPKQFSDFAYAHKLSEESERRSDAAFHRDAGTEADPGDFTMGAEFTRDECLSHCHWMCQQALSKFFDGPTKDVDKAMRWMCYVQGVANVFGIYSCNDLRDHSRSGKEEFKTPAEEHDGEPFEVTASLVNDLRLAVIECDGDNLVSLAKRSVICSANSSHTISVSDLIPRIEFDAVEAKAATEAGFDPENGFPGWDVVFDYIDKNPGLLKTVVEIEDVAAKPAEEHGKSPIDAVKEAAVELLDHIDSCDEDDLLALDEDPHPPSAMSVHADYLRRAIAKLP